MLKYGHRSPIWAQVAGIGDKSFNGSGFNVALVSIYADSFPLVSICISAYVL